jgi:hypothetical protein
MNLASKKAFRVVKYLLGNTSVKQREISRSTGVALGYVNEIVNYSLDIGVLEKKSGHYGVDDPVRLLEKVSFDRPFKGLELAEFRLPAFSIDESESLLIKQLGGDDLEYAFTAFSGLRRYFEYHISYPLVHIYVSNSGAINYVERGEGAVPVVFLKADRPEIFGESREIDGTRVCDNVQVAIDLFSSGLGRDAAIKFLEVIRAGDQRYPS